MCECKDPLLSTAGISADRLLLKLMESIAEACLLGLTSEGWSGAEAFYTVAPTTQIWEQEGDQGLSSTGLAKKYHSQAKLRDGYYDGQSGRGRGFFDCTKAEKLLGWQHK